MKNTGFIFTPHKLTPEEMRFLTTNTNARIMMYTRGMYKITKYFQAASAGSSK